MTATLLVEALNSTITLVAAALPAVQVTYEWPRPENQPAAGMVCGADPLSADGSAGPLKAGRKHPREEGTLTLVAQVLDDSQLTADRACVDLAEQVETVIADNPTLGLEHIHSAVVTGKRFERGPHPDTASNGSRVFLTVTYSATLR